MSLQSRLPVMMDQRLWSVKSLLCVMLLCISKSRLGMGA